MGVSFIIRLKIKDKKRTQEIIADFEKIGYKYYGGHSITMPGRWLQEAEDMGWHHAWDYLYEKSGWKGYPAVLKGDEVSRMMKKVKIDLEEHSHTGDNAVDFECLYKFLAIAKKYGMDIEYT